MACSGCGKKKRDYNVFDALHDEMMGALNKKDKSEFLVPLEVRNERLSICMECPKLIRPIYICSECTCKVRAATRYSNKECGMKDHTKRKWFAYEAPISDTQDSEKTESE